MVHDEVLRRYKNPLHQKGLDAEVARWEASALQVVEASGHNRMCGDSLRMAFAFGAGEAQDAPWILQDACFEGYGCSLSIASADTLIEHLLSKGAHGCADDTAETLLGLLGGIEVSKTRRHCVELPLAIAREAYANLE